MVQGVTFDCWNTLIYVADLSAVFEERVKRIQKVLEKAGHEIRPTTLRDQALSVYEIVRNRQYLEGLDFTPKEQVEALLRRLDIPVSEAIFSAVYTTYTEVILEAPPQLVDGALEVVAELAERFPLALICNTGASPGQVVRPLLKKFGLAPFLKVQTFSDEERIAKPNPKIFQRTLARLGLPPEGTVHIGDDPLTDMTGARKVGMQTIWFNPKPGKEVPACTWQVESLRQIPALLLPN